MEHLCRICIFVVFLMLKFQASLATEMIQSSGRNLHVHYLRISIPRNRFKKIILQNLTAETTVYCGLSCLQKRGCVTSIFNVKMKKCFLLNKYFGPLDEYNPKTEGDEHTRMTVAFAMEPCNPNPCHKDGKCEVNELGYQCICPYNRTGRFCDQEITANSCLSIKKKFNKLHLQSGAYKIVSSNARLSFIAYCDMDYLNGGWTRVLNLKVGKDTDKSHVSAKMNYYHKLENVKSTNNFTMTNSALKHFREISNFTQVRFKCRARASNSILHIKTNVTAVIDYLTSGNVTKRPSSCGTFERLKDDNSTLGQRCQHWNDRKWGIGYPSDKALTDHPFFESHARQWVIDVASRFECDGRADAPITTGDFWEVYVK